MRGFYPRYKYHSRELRKLILELPIETCRNRILVTHLIKLELYALGFKNRERTKRTEISTLFNVRWFKIEFQLSGQKKVQAVTKIGHDKNHNEHIPTFCTQNTQSTIIYMLGKTLGSHLYLNLDSRTIGKFQELWTWKYSFITRNLQKHHCICEEKKKSVNNIKHPTEEET